MIKKIFYIWILSIIFHSPVFADPGISGDIFGQYIGILHPSLSIDMMYSDNIYKTNENTKSDFITTFSPSIWLAFPGIKKKLPEIDVSNTSPGGLSLELTKSDTFKRYQTFFYYSPQVIKYLDFSDESIENNRLGSVFQFNLRGGLSINLIDQFKSAHEAMGVGMGPFQDRYTSNIVYLIVSYDMTEKISLRADYSNFQLKYNSDQLSYGDRSDNSFAAYFYYKVLYKTSLFTEIDYVNVGYDTPGFYDSNELRYFAGVKWEITDKTDGSFKTGYGAKDFSEDSVNNSGDLILELSANIAFTPKTKVKITGLRRSTETTVLDTEYSIVNSIIVNYNQNITEKIGLDFGVLIASERYVGDVLYIDEVSEREDNRFRFLSAINYRLNDWFSTRAEYSYSNRNSSVGDFDYSNNVFMMSITGAL